MSVLSFAFAALSSATATVALSSFALRARIADDPASAPHRKLQAAPVPAVGGAAVLVGLVALEACLSSPIAGPQGEPGVWIALLLAFGVGLVDDKSRGGLPAGALLAGQSIVAAALVWGGWRLCAGPPGLVLVASFLAVLVALNAVNTFDNADGAASALAILGLGCGARLLAAPVVGFLPWNLLCGRRSAPIAYLGNSGSHVLGVLLVLDPIGRAALLLPILDLLRLAFVRVRVGSRPWLGDRRHLAHRLQTAGLSALPVALALIAIAAPAVLGRASGTASGFAVGSLATGLLFVAAVRFTPRIE